MTSSSVQPPLLPKARWSRRLSFPEIQIEEKIITVPNVQQTVVDTVMQIMTCDNVFWYVLIFFCLCDMGETVTSEMCYHIAYITEFNYPITLATNFQDAGSLQYLSTSGESGVLMPGVLGVIFIDFLDTQRSHAG